MRIAISIPKPCHEDWNAMTPKQGARFCDSCQHSVADLTRATDAELVALFTSDAKPKCARFDPRQLERVLGDPQPSRHTLPIAAFSSLIAVAAGQEAMAQGGDRLYTVGEPAISAPPPPNISVKGKMRVAPSLPLDTVAPCTIKMGEVMPVPHSIPAGLDPERTITGDTVVMEQPELHMVGQMMVRPVTTYCYIDGVKVSSPEDSAPPDHRIGDVKVITGGIPGTYGDGGTAEPFCSDTAAVRDLPLTGRVVDAETGRVLRSATVEWVEAGLHCCTDVNGAFGFPVKMGDRSTAITLRISAAGHAPQEQELPMDQLPFCVPIALPRSTEPQVPLTPTTIDMGDVKIQHYQPMTMGLVITRKPTLWERVKSPFRR